MNPFYAACPEIVQRTMDRFAELTGRRYGLFEYHGATDAERVIVLMGSGCEAVHETVDFLNSQNEKVGVLKVRLYRPLDAQTFVKMLPANVRRLAVDPAMKGEGLGARLLDAAVERARDEGFEVAELSTLPDHPWLPAFYRKHGFEDRSVESMVKDGSEWLLMRRKLGP